MGKTIIETEPESDLALKFFALADRLISEEGESAGDKLSFGKLDDCGCE